MPAAWVANDASDWFCPVSATTLLDCIEAWPCAVDFDAAGLVTCAGTPPLPVHAAIVGKPAMPATPRERAGVPTLVALMPALLIALGDALVLPAVAPRVVPGLGVDATVAPAVGSGSGSVAASAVDARDYDRNGLNEVGDEAV